MSFIWTYNNEPVTFGGLVATFGGPALTTYGHQSALIADAAFQSEFNTSFDETLALVTSDSFTLTETTNFSAMSAGVRINNSSTGNVEFLLWSASSGVPVTLIAITGNIAVPATSGLPVLVTADVTGVPLFQNVPLGEYTLSVQATGESIRLASSTSNTGNPFYQKGDNVDVVGNPWRLDGGNRSRHIIYIEGSPAAGITESIAGDITSNITTEITG